MQKDEIVRLVEKYQKKAQKAFDNYQYFGAVLFTSVEGGCGR